MLLDRDGVGVELSREAYEAGDWANKVQEAYSLGKKEKARKRREGEKRCRTRLAYTVAVVLASAVDERKSRRRLTPVTTQHSR